jgi:hypothetical protein
MIDRTWCGHREDEIEVRGNSPLFLCVSMSLRVLSSVSSLHLPVCVVVVVVVVVAVMSVSGEGQESAAPGRKGGGRRGGHIVGVEKRERRCVALLFSRCSKKKGPMDGMLWDECSVDNGRWRRNNAMRVLFCVFFLTTFFFLLSPLRGRWKGHLCLFRRKGKGRMKEEQTEWVRL